LLLEDEIKSAESKLSRLLFIRMTGQTQMYSRSFIVFFTY